MGEPSAFFIRELTGEENTLTLIGRALPYRPLTFEGSMRAEFTWYPGNPISTVQMLGPQEGTTSINGMWKDRFIKTTTDLGLPVIGQTGKAYYNGGLVNNVSDLVKLADGFRRRGQLLEITWDGIVRQGILTKFKHTWHRVEDVEWEMEFTWMSQGEDELPIAFNVLAGLADQINSIVDAVNGLIEAVNELKDEFAAIASWINAVNTFVDNIATAASALVDLYKQAVSLAVAPLSAAGNMIAACQTIADNAKDLGKTFESLPPRMVRAVGIDSEAETQDMVLAAERVIRKAKRAARRVRSEAVKKQQETIAQSQDQSAPLATIIARDGMDLRDISTRYYNTPHEWIRLKLYNGFNSSRLLAGDVVIVPRLGTAGTTVPASTLKAP